MADSFGERVAAAVAGTGPLCAGIDPSADLLGAWGLSRRRRGPARLLRRPASRRSPASCAVVKPQVAFFERHGVGRAWPRSSGCSPTPRAAGLLVIADAKRGDIDSTAAAYADAWLGEASPLAADAVTVHPYLGLGALAPAGPAWPRPTGRGVIVVARSSNPEGRLCSRRSRPAGRSVEDSSWPRSPS